MYFTGFADEAAADIDGQIKATKVRGSTYIEYGNRLEAMVKDILR